ncbi:MAG: methylglyoxal synthase [Oscillospiraceae bacterium]|nr:methylglyoxal synthase [Oscillospiraceae bacterium]
MNIALLAHDSKKELMIQFCIAYRAVLSQHRLIATRTTGKVISDVAELEIKPYLSGDLGGCQQVAASISCNEIDALFFFRDPLNVGPGERDDTNVLKACDTHNIPLATNLATGEALIHALERGDLDWREIAREGES